MFVEVQLAERVGLVMFLPSDLARLAAILGLQIDFVFRLKDFCKSRFLRRIEGTNQPPIDDDPQLLDGIDRLTERLQLRCRLRDLRAVASRLERPAKLRLRGCIVFAFECPLSGRQCQPDRFVAELRIV